jgi:hypothetical protein
MAEHKYTQTTENDRWQVEISPSTRYGWFQNLKTGQEGGLWFEDAPSHELRDYDGWTCLPRQIGAILHAMGYTVDPVCYVDDLPLTPEELAKGLLTVKGSAPVAA